MACKKMTDEELIAALRKEIAAWFSNVHLLEFEELIRRFNTASPPKARARRPSHE
jgi:hypothetical protein